MFITFTVLLRHAEAAAFAIVTFTSPLKFALSLTFGHLSRLQFKGGGFFACILLLLLIDLRQVV